MTEASSANLEMAIILPLGVVAHQLMKIEADLRHLNTKALDLAKDRENQHRAGLIEARLENINGALDSIRDLVSKIEEHIHSRLSDTVYSPANRKPNPDRDD